jgi:phthalate 4,5-dioxygenase reductase subunit
MRTPSDPDLSLLIARRDEIASGIHAFELQSPDGGELPEFTAGAHIAVRTPNGMVRKYSLCGDPAQSNRYMIAVKREHPGTGGTNNLIDEANVGDTLMVSAPQNDFELARNAKQFVFIAGGIGITPIRSMIHHLLAQTGKQFRLHYLTRSPDVTAFREEFGAPEFKGKVFIHHDGGVPERAFDLWPVLEERKNNAHIYCCGPRPLMESVRDMAGHWPRSALHFEAFTEPSAPKADDTAFTVKLARANITFDVPVGTTILEASRAHGHDIPSSCESGTCGTCKCRLLEGEADHRDLVLSDEERATHIMVCVSRAKSPQLVIDR